MEKVSERFLLQDEVFALLPRFKLDKKCKIGLPEHFSEHSVLEMLFLKNCNCYDKEDY